MKKHYEIIHPGTTKDIITKKNPIVTNKNHKTTPSTTTHRPPENPPRKEGK